MDNLNGFFGNIFEIPMNPGDYKAEDGCVVCGTCGQHKQQMHKGLRIPRNCACSQAKLEQARAAETARQHRERVESIRRRGFLEQGICKKTFDTLDEQDAQITAVCKNFADRFAAALEQEHCGIFLHGTPGTGKSHHAFAIANAVAELEYTVLCGTVSGIASHIQGEPPEYSKTMHMVETVDLLVLDDFCATRDTDYSWELVYRIINTRYNAGKPTIITTNQSSDTLEASQDKWAKLTMSRITEMCPIQLALVGKDRRKEKAAAARQKCRELFL